jgi:N-acetylated-alpha-linked acidic dipeptidase
MEKFGDPTFAYHATMTKITGLMAMNLADRPLIPIEPLTYARQLRREVRNAQAILKELNAKPLTQFDDLVKKINDWSKVAESWRKAASNAGEQDALRLKNLNENLMSIDRAFISLEGLRGRTWYKNLYAAPGEYTGYAAITLPGLRDCFDRKDWERLPIEESKLLKAVEAAMLATQAALDLVQQRVSGGGK